MKLKSFVAAGVLVAGATFLGSVSASARLVDFTLSGSGFTASGVLTIGTAQMANPWPCPSCNNGLGYVVTNISGQINGTPIAGLLPLNAYYGNDNLIYQGSPYLDWGGLGFKAGGYAFNVFQGNYRGYFGYYLANSEFGGSIYAFPVQFSAVFVPEPGTLALFGMALLALGGLSLRRKSA